jgi:DNA topoisomerase IB
VRKIKKKPKKTKKPKNRKKTKKPKKLTKNSAALMKFIMTKGVRRSKTRLTLMNIYS